VSWLPGRVLDRNAAITAMTLADTAAEPGMNRGHRLWPFIEGWAEELGLTGPEAIALASQRSGSSRHEEHATCLPGPEAEPEAEL
jgi:hypothetical protein